MHGFRRYLGLGLVQLRTALVSAAQYRVDFVVQGALALLWTALALVPLWVVYGHRADIAGWSRPEALVVVGLFTILGGVLEGAINPSLSQVVVHVRQGTLDFVLLKPADAQFLVSTAAFAPFRVVDLGAGLAIIGYAFASLGHGPAASAVASALLLLGVAVLVLYSLWILIVSAAFWVIKLDNLSFLFTSLFDFARWPVSVFRGTVFRFVFTFVFPIALLTTFPAEALLARLHPGVGVAALAGGLAFAAVARWVWKRALALYTSASS